MKQEKLHPEGAPPPSAPYTPVIKVGETVWTSGQAPFGADGAIHGANVAEQTEVVFDNLEAALKAAGATLADVVKVTAHLQDLHGDFDAYNEVYARRFGSHRPCRTTVGSTLGGFLVEIDCVAAVGSGA
ncbi:MAG: RidA family protein [Actinobacteria bacterium]|nr:RidA family protein [Actinomycetota bacterium]